MALGTVAILAGILVPLVLKTLNDARMARARNDIQVIAKALANQMRDTGGRRPIHIGPNDPGGPQGLSVLYSCKWVSGGRFPRVQEYPNPGSLLGAYGEAIGACPFSALFCTPEAQTNTTMGQANYLFGFPANTPATAEFRYKGPYMDSRTARLTDPWGRAYLILGYNEYGRISDGPIWVVSAGPGGSISSRNLQPLQFQMNYHPTWDYSGESKTNIAVRVH